MYETPEIPSLTPASAETGRIFFSIYYVHPVRDRDGSFKRAAATWKRRVSLQESFRSGVDVFLEQDVRTEPQFRAAWNGMAEQARTNNLPVWIGHVFTHATKEDAMSDGLEFESVRSDGTINQSDIRALDMMPWDPNGYLVLAGCNTGLVGSTRLWCPAQEFAHSQRVRTLSMTGFSSFSSNWNTFVKATTSHREIALWAYKKGRNGALGSGLRMPGRMFTP